MRLAKSSLHLARISHRSADSLVHASPISTTETRGQGCPRSVTVFACLGLLMAAISALASEPVVIGVIGDFGAAVIGPGPASNELAVANLVKRWNPDFIMALGDNNYPGGAALTIDPNIGQFYHEYIFPYLGSYGSGA